MIKKLISLPQYTIEYDTAMKKIEMALNNEKKDWNELNILTYKDI